MTATAAARPKARGGPLPPDAAVPKAYTGQPRIIVPTVRTSIAPGEMLRLKVIVLSNERPSKAALHWRKRGDGKYKPVPRKHVARGVYTVGLPPGGAGSDVLEGGEAEDLFIGGTGNDDLRGHGGNDTYRFFDGYGTDDVIEAVTAAADIDTMDCEYSHASSLSGFFRRMSSANPTMPLSMLLKSCATPPAN